MDDVASSAWYDISSHPKHNQSEDQSKMEEASKAL
jgi:hypothetical protein